MLEKDAAGWTWEALADASARSRNFSSEVMMSPTHAVHWFCVRWSVT